MTTINVSKSRKQYLIVLKGHAGFDMSGNDVVCHGISMLGFTLLQALLDAEETGLLRNLSQRIDDAEIEASFEPVNRGKVDVILDTILCGFRLLQTRYPDYCKLEVGGEIAL